MSWVGIVLLTALWLAMLVSLGVSAFGQLAWLDFLYIISYVKLGVTPIKYIPQVFIVLLLRLQLVEHLVFYLFHWYAGILQL